MAKKPTRPSSKKQKEKEIAIRVNEELESFATATGHSVPELIEGFSKAWRTIPYQFLKRMKVGNVETTFRDIFSVSEIGETMDEQIKSMLGLEKYFMVDDVGIDLAEKCFGFNYESTTDSKGTVCSVSVTIDPDCIGVQYTSESPLIDLREDFKTIVKGFDDDLLSRVDDYRFDYEEYDHESCTISLGLTLERDDELPTVSDVSHTIDRLNKFLERRREKLPVGEQNVAHKELRTRVKKA